MSTMKVGDFTVPIPISQRDIHELEIVCPDHNKQMEYSLLMDRYHCAHGNSKELPWCHRVLNCEEIWRAWRALTSGGIALTDELMQKLANEAEQGYDVESLHETPE